MEKRTKAVVSAEELRDMINKMKEEHPEWFDEQGQLKGPQSLQDMKHTRG